MPLLAVDISLGIKLLIT